MSELFGFVLILKYFKFKILLILSHFLFGWSAGINSIILVLGLQKMIFAKDAPWAPIIIEELLNNLIWLLKVENSGFKDLNLLFKRNLFTKFGLLIWQWL